MQTFFIPYTCPDEDRAAIREMRRIQSAAVRSAYANALGADGKFRSEKEIRALVKSRFAGGRIDAWSLHCATRQGISMRHLTPDGSAVFGGKKDLERRRKGLISREDWREARLLPLYAIGDKTVLGNRHIRLDRDAAGATLRMYKAQIRLDLTGMRGNAGEILRQAAVLAAEGRIGITFRLDATHLHATIDPEDLPDHPQRRVPVAARPGRCLGVDLNPSSIGIAVAENRRDPQFLAETRLRDHALIGLAPAAGAPAELTRSVLAAAVDRMIGMARQHGCGLIAVEKGLGHLRSGGKSRRMNGVLNAWARTLLTCMLRRRAKLAGIEVVEVWAGYSSTIGNLAFAAPDACAAACEIARRGLARRAGHKELLPRDDAEGWDQWKDPSPREAAAAADGITWTELHRKIKAAKIGYRRPHPALRPGSDPRKPATADGYAVARLGGRFRPGLWLRPETAQAASSRTTVVELSTRKSG